MAAGNKWAWAWAWAAWAREWGLQLSGGEHLSAAYQSREARLEPSKTVIFPATHH